MGAATRRLRRELAGLPSADQLRELQNLERQREGERNSKTQQSLQAGSLALALISQAPREVRENEPLFAKARQVLDGLLDQTIEALAALNAPEAAEEDDDEDDEEQQIA
jgi:hypothetical protein